MGSEMCIRDRGRAGSVVYYLSPNGSLRNAGGVHFEASSPDSVVRQIESYGKISGECVLILWVENEHVDFDSVVAAMQSFGGIEKKFSRFRIEIMFSNSPSADQVSEQERGIAPRNLAKEEDNDVN